MNRAGNDANCGADPHFSSRLPLTHAAIEVLENRRLLSGSHDYIWKEAENFDGAQLAADLHRWDAFSYAGFNGSGVRAMESDKVKYEFGHALGVEPNNTHTAGTIMVAQIERGSYLGSGIFDSYPNDAVDLLDAR